MYRGRSFHGDDKENNDFVEGRGCELLVWDNNLMTVPSVPPESPEILGGAIIQTQVIFLLMHSTILFYCFTIDLNTEEQKSKNSTLFESIIDLLFSESGGPGGQAGMYIKAGQTSRWGHNKMETVTNDDEDDDEANCE